MPTLEIAHVRLRSPPTTSPSSTTPNPWPRALRLASTASGTRFSLYSGVATTTTTTTSSFSPPDSNTNGNSTSTSITNSKALSSSDLFLVGTWLEHSSHVAFLSSPDAKAMAKEIGSFAEVVGVRFVAVAKGELVGAGLLDGHDLGENGDGGEYRAKETLVVRVWNVEDSRGWVQKRAAARLGRDGKYVAGWDEARELMGRGREVFDEVQRLSGSREEAFHGMDDREQGGTVEKMWVEITVGGGGGGTEHENDKGSMEGWVLKYML